jgi:hypothetical protein
VEQAILHYIVTSAIWKEVLKTKKHAGGNQEEQWSIIEESGKRHFKICREIKEFKLGNQKYRHTTVKFLKIWTLLHENRNARRKKVTATSFRRENKSHRRKQWRKRKSLEQVPAIPRTEENVQIYWRSWWSGSLAKYTGATSLYDSI